MGKKKVQSEHTMGVLLERMDKKIDHVLEGHAVLDKKIEGFNSNLNKKIDDFRFEMRTELNHVKAEVRLTNYQLKDLVVRIDRIEDKYDKNFNVIMKYLSRIDDEIQDMKKSLAGKVDTKRILILEQHMTEVRLALDRKFGKNWNE